MNPSLVEPVFHLDQIIRINVSRRSLKHWSWLGREVFGSQVVIFLFMLSRSRVLQVGWPSRILIDGTITLTVFTCRIATPRINEPITDLGKVSTSWITLTWDAKRWLVKEG